MKQFKAQKTRLLFLMMLIFVPLTSIIGGERVDIIQIEKGTINPVSSEYITDAIERAEYEDSECLILLLDTPGGLLTATQDIVKAMLSAKVPTVVYVYPGGAGAVSAGVSITMGAHIAAMAPGTSIGAAHPVSGGKTDSSDVGIQKATKWWASFNRSIAEKRGRNADWVEQAVTQSVSITENEALEKNVIDLIAPSLDSLLILLDGREVELDTGTVVLKTKEATISRHNMNLRSRILDLISNPSIAYILFTLGLLGMYFELSNPGTILPGVVGGIFLIVAFFAMQQLPVNIAGILLIIFATILFILEVKIPSYGVLTIGGIVSMLLGSLMLFKSTPTLQVQLPLTVILTATAATALFFIFAVGKALQAQSKKVTTGSEGIIGEIGTAVTRIAPEGQVKIHGEYWKAQSNENIPKNTRVIVKDVDKLILMVEEYVK